MADQFTSGYITETNIPGRWAVTRLFFWTLYQASRPWWAWNIWRAERRRTR